MALFQRNPHSDKQKQPIFTTIGMNKTILIVGLGNVGKSFDYTRHNVGFTCVDAFAEAHDFENWVEKKDFKCFLTMKVLGDTRVVLCKPTTFMNLSGEAVQKVMHFYKLSLDQVVVVHDELDVNFGQIRIRVGGSDAGNNGIKSLIQHIGKDFARVRIGIGNKEAQGQMDGADFVLSKFSEDERTHITALTREATSTLTEYVFSGKLPHDTRTFVS